MDITKLSFVARTRTSWEVFDLTQLMVRSNFFPMMKIIILLYVPLALVFWAIFSAGTASLILWWLKPLLERPLLDFLAKKSFSQPTTSWSCIKAIKHLSKTDILTMLTINRFSPNRAYFAPVSQLEKLQGKKKAARKNILLSRNQHKQTFWMLFCVHIEFVFTALFIVVAINFIPQGIKLDDQFIMDNLTNKLYEQVYFITYLIAMMLMTPYFVTGGFLAYLNTRVNLEAWDLELAFKQIANRMSKVAAVMLVVITTFTTEIPSVSAEGFQSGSEKTQPNSDPTQVNNQAELSAENTALVTDALPQDNPSSEESTTPTEADLTRIAVEKIYQDNELIEKTTMWQPVLDENQEEMDLTWLKDFLKVLSGSGEYIGYIFWILLIGLVAWVATKLYAIMGEGRFRGGNIAKTSSKQAVQMPSFFSSIDNQNWPEDLLLAAKKANADSKYREALTYLLRFSLLLAEQNTSVIIQAWMTERECETALINVLPSDYHAQYQQLFSVWVQHAWAHKAVNKQQIDELISEFSALETVGAE